MTLLETDTSSKYEDDFHQTQNPENRSKEAEKRTRTDKITREYFDNGPKENNIEEPSGSHSSHHSHYQILDKETKELSHSFPERSRSVSSIQTDTLMDHPMVVNLNSLQNQVNLNKFTRIYPTSK